MQSNQKTLWSTDDTLTVCADRSAIKTSFANATSDRDEAIHES